MSRKNYELDQLAYLQQENQRLYTTANQDKKYKIDLLKNFRSRCEVLNNINLHVDAGKKLALVGPSGGGKTTICHLIPNFYKLEEGKIFIDDKAKFSILKTFS